MQITIIPIFIILAGVLAAIIIAGLRKGQSGTKLMLMGIHITLVGGILAIDTGSNLRGLEYIIVFLGLILSIAGLIKGEE